MGEAIIVGRGTGGGSSFQNHLITEIILENTNWIAPKALNQSFSVRIFGGGGNIYAGGGGGYMNNNILIINSGELIPIYLGKGGSGYIGYNSSKALTGGTTFFGSYLSANGGGVGYMHGGNGGSGGGSNGYSGGEGEQFGGGGSNGYFGGKWGGGGGANGYAQNKNGGGHGGMYGRGGAIIANKYIYNSILVSRNGGIYGGNGGVQASNNYNLNAENGTNTIGIGLDFEGIGLAGNNNVDSYRCGGGGYGGCGGIAYGGGGGYGGNGGNSCGGGGGYGADGGCEMGGGGGYGKYGYGGNGCGGGGGYGPGGDGIYRTIGGQRYVERTSDGIFGGGGGAALNSEHDGGNGGNGICIIQYYI